MFTVEQLLSIAKEKKASDVHVTVGLPPRVRINGELVDLDYPKLSPDDCEKLILDIMDDRQQAMFKDRGELDFSFSVPNIGRYRVNVFRQRGSVACAMRIVGTEIPKPESLGVPKSVVELYAGKDTTFSVNERKQLDDILVRLQKLEPIQYIIGTEEFYGLTFEVNKHVLIPRPETGELVDWIIREHKYGRVRILDIGTGSGCIAVSLAKNLEEAEVVSWDVSEKALQVAERNCRRNGVRVILEQRDVLLASPAGERFDVIVSNPPYITEKERADMSANVLEWEPELALFVPDDSPLLFYRKIAELGRDMLVSGGRLYFEINQEYGRETVDMLAGLEYKNIKLRKDLFQNDRMIKAEK